MDQLVTRTYELLNRNYEEEEDKEHTPKATATKEEIPEPISQKQYSGKFQVRTTPEQHKMLAIKASEEGVSLNRYINFKLSD